ncbi:MAG TPA: glyoxalase, partial [Rhodospirillaceae bacterium]|nr:glyoxalase [Rhodospirillaceae bacterium]
SYIAVEDVDATAKQVIDAGGAIRLPPTNIPELGRISIISDPTGAVVALIRPDEGQPEEVDDEAGDNEAGNGA